MQMQVKALCWKMVFRMKVRFHNQMDHLLWDASPLNQTEMCTKVKELKSPSGLSIFWIHQKSSECILWSDFLFWQNLPIVVQTHLALDSQGFFYCMHFSIVALSECIISKSKAQGETALSSSIRIKLGYWS